MKIKRMIAKYKEDKRKTERKEMKGKYKNECNEGMKRRRDMKRIGGEKKEKIMWIRKEE